MFCVNCIRNKNIITTHRELRERRPWKASDANSEIWLLLKSLWRTGPKEKRENKRQRGTKFETWKVKHSGWQMGQKHYVFVGGWQGAKYMYLLIYSHPAQLLIRRKGPSWDHLDGVLLQSSGTKHTHRPLKSDINIPLSQSYLYPWLLLVPRGST